MTEKLQDMTEPDLTTAEEILDTTEPDLTMAETFLDTMEPGSLATYEASANPLDEELRASPQDEASASEIRQDEAPKPSRRGYATVLTRGL